jgi:hypothetical protein
VLLSRVVLCLSLVLIALPASAGNLVGTWVGRFSCSAEDANGRFKSTETDSVLQISQPGGAGTSPLRLTIDGTQYSGSIIPSASSPTTDGVGAFVACGTSDAEGAGFNEIELIRWKVDGGTGRGSIKKAGVYVENGVQIGACKGGWVRTTTADPGIGACP